MCNCALPPVAGGCRALLSASEESRDSARRDTGDGETLVPDPGRGEGHSERGRLRHSLCDVTKGEDTLSQSNRAAEGSLRAAESERIR